MKEAEGKLFGEKALVGSRGDAERLVALLRPAIDRVNKSNVNAMFDITLWADEGDVYFDLRSNPWPSKEVKVS